ncbi:MAG TPA: hypothetical protein VJ756_23075 [Terriglobales bacterium]|jgi:hypothetical protein|nr:hypothetical protein [Terriglobales bacterium]
MLAKCANPACSAPFLYLREGKLYQIEMQTEMSSAAGEQKGGVAKDDRKPARRLEFFWLCGRCARQMTLSFDRGRGVVVVPTRTQRAVAT